jgi:ribosomal protein S18 acetylase RimI-like enzyme
MAERPPQLTGLRRVTPDDADLLVGLFGTLSERDLSFLEPRLDRETLARWGTDDDPAARWLVEDGGEAQAYLAVIRAQGWSNHVGDLRLVVADSRRGEGLGRLLARHGLLEGVRLGLQKLTVAVAASAEGTIEMFTSIGFRAEALLENHIRDRTGALHDLVLLSHDVSQVYEDLVSVGIDAEIGPGGPA